jgi:hypothetical protein
MHLSSGESTQRLSTAESTPREFKAPQPQADSFIVGRRLTAIC